MIKTVIFTGGGSGGHVLPALTLIRYIKKNYPDVHIEAMGSYRGIEAGLFKEEGIPYKAISTGKLRRYFSWQNFSDLFRLAWGFFQSFFFLLKFSRKETVVFGTGGFVIVPVVLAAKFQFKKVLIHEQTSRVGLANKIASYVADKVMLTFEASLNYFPKNKAFVSGYPLREEILAPEPLSTFSLASQNKENRPILFLTGGGNGSLLLNDVLLKCLPQLEKTFFIIHQCGSQFFEELKSKQTDTYRVFPFIKEEMISLMNEATVVISRAGAGTVVELMSLGKPSIFIPLKIAQKNEQYHNAMEAHEKLGSIVIKEDDMSEEALLEAIVAIQKRERCGRVDNSPTKSIVEKALGVNS